MLTYKAAKWILFFGLAMVVPLFYYLFVIGGLLPLGGILLLTFCDATEGGMIFIDSVHLVVYGGLLYFLACKLTKRLFTLPGRFKLYGTSLLLIGLLYLGFVPMFGIGHHAVRVKDAYSLYGEAYLFYDVGSFRRMCWRVFD